MKAFTLVLCLVGLSQAAKLPRRTESYEGQKVFRCHDIPNNFSLQAPGVDVWAENADKSVDIRLMDRSLEKHLMSMASCTTIVHNVEQLVREFEQKMHSVGSAAEWFDEYHTYEEIRGWYQQLATDHSNLVRFVSSIGRSTENREMPAVHIAGESQGNSSHHKFFFQCQIHAREWISGATCMYIANYLVTRYGVDQEVTDLLNEIEVVFIVFTNPDGYEYTWNGDRLWRKNRRVNSGSTCRGVDQNRNYNIRWGESGSSSNPCSDTFHGTGPASEPETQHAVNYFKINEPIIGAIDWHSYSQLILRPWGFTYDDSPDEVRLNTLGQEMSDRIYAVHGQRYTSQKSIGLYPTSGTASDWFYSTDANENNLGYRAAGFTFELRDTGRYGFLLPPDQIIPTGEEIIVAVLHYMQSLTSQPLFL